jgi:stage V sporulation protein G
MNITDVKIRRLYLQGKMKAVVSVTFDQAIVIHDIRILKGNQGLFVAMPSRRTMDGVFLDIAHPISTQAREMLERAVLAAYQKAYDAEMKSAQAQQNDRALA